jgi:hypothetical protein
MINPREFYFRLVEKTGAGQVVLTKIRHLAADAVIVITQPPSTSNAKENSVMKGRTTNVIAGGFSSNPNESERGTSVEVAGEDDVHFHKGR